MTAHTRARGEGSIYPYRNGRYVTDYPKTAETYARNIRLQVMPYLGETRLDRLGVADVRRWLRQLASVSWHPSAGIRLPVLRAG
jgi:hypothetical protein